MKPIEDCNVGIVGLGLMGGAIAINLASSCAVSAARIFAFDTDKKALNAACDAGVIGKSFSSPEEMLPFCDMVFLCLNPSAILEFMDRWMNVFSPGCLITDIAGIKGSIVSSLEHTLRPDLDFIPGHPMTGSEKAGFANAPYCNFKGKNYILTPLKQNKQENLDFLKALIYRMGFGRITETTAEEHDRKIAFTSQLCHVIAAALIDCEGDTKITRFGGGSFEDLTRIAMLNVPMWTELFIENRYELFKRIEQFKTSLDALKTLIQEENSGELETRLAAVRDQRIKMTG